MYSENRTEAFHSPAIVDVCSGSNTSPCVNDSENVGTYRVPYSPITSLIAFNSNPQSSTSERELSIVRKAASAIWRYTRSPRQRPLSCKPLTISALLQLLWIKDIRYLVFQKRAQCGWKSHNLPRRLTQEHFLCAAIRSDLPQCRDDSILLRLGKTNR